MACSICAQKAISRKMAATKSSTVGAKTLGSNGAAVFSNTSPRMVSHSTRVSPGVTPGSTSRLPKVGK